MMKQQELREYEGPYDDNEASATNCERTASGRRTYSIRLFNKSFIYSSLVICLLPFVLRNVGAQINRCPSELYKLGCECGNNLIKDKTGMTVICDKGGMREIPIDLIPAETRILIISGTPQRPNEFRLDVHFSKFKQLEELRLTDSTNAKAIGEDRFFELNNTLRILDLSRNQLYFLLEVNFRRLPKLQELRLDYNMIGTLNSATFAYVPNLKILSLKGNQMKELPIKFGNGLHYLEELDISNNPIGNIRSNAFLHGTIPASAFNDTGNLKSLNLANTSISRIPFEKLQENLPNLDSLGLEGVPICLIEDGMFNRFKRIRELKLEGMARKCNNGFEIRNGAFVGMPNLEVLSLKNNNLQKLDGVLYEVKTLKDLDLSYNDLEDLTVEELRSVAEGRRLQRLSVAGNNRLKLKPRMFAILPTLRTVSFRDMKLFDNQIPAELFAYDNVIETVNLSRNNIQEFPALHFEYLAELKNLDLSENHLEQVPRDMHKSSQLQRVYLHQNRLTAFPGNQLQDLRANTDIELLAVNNNPWKCDCGVYDMYRWVTATTTTRGKHIICWNGQNYTCPMCAEPFNFAGQRLNMLGPDSFSTCVSRGDPLVFPLGRDSNSVAEIVVPIVVCIIALIIALVLFVWWYRNRLISYYTREEKRTDRDDSLYAESGTMGREHFPDVTTLPRPTATIKTSSNGNGFQHSPVSSHTTATGGRAESDV